MYGKISDEKIRREKVNKLKRKILSEINSRISYIKAHMITDTNNKYFDLFIKTSYALLRLKEYIEDDNCFMEYVAKYHNEDIVIYIVSDKNLNIWMSDDYSFISIYLLNAEDIDYNVDFILTDQYFEYNFTSICESILYDKRQNKAV